MAARGMARFSVSLYSSADSFTAFPSPFPDGYRFPGGPGEKNSPSESHGRNRAPTRSHACPARCTAAAVNVRDAANAKFRFNR